MASPDSMTRICLTRVAPARRAPDDESIHGFAIRDGAIECSYVAELRVTGDVHWLDLAVSVSAGTIALRVWLDPVDKVVRTRLLAPHEVDEHPALALADWLTAIEVAALAVDPTALADRVVLGDDRLAAHLWYDAEEFVPTALAAPIGR
jgi:hypothetical protein